jgi:single-strand DNA-binding protein
VKRYEGLFILNTAAKEDGIKDVIDKISKEIEAAGGKVETTQKMDKKSFSRVANKKHNSGFYLNVIFEGAPTTLATLHRRFAMNDDVFRVMFRPHRRQKRPPNRKRNSMASFNRVILVGNLTRDPELRYTPNGKAIAKIGLAVNRAWTTESGEKKEEVTFVDVDTFGRTAENVGQYMRKGSPILIEGRLRLDQWDDKQTGQKRSKLGVVAEIVQFLGGPRGGDSGGGAPAPNRPRTAEPPPGSPTPTEAEAPPAEDDVPF